MSSCFWPAWAVILNANTIQGWLAIAPCMLLHSAMLSICHCMTACHAPACPDCLPHVLLITPMPCVLQPCPASSSWPSAPCRRMCLRSRGCSRTTSSRWAPSPPSPTAQPAACCLWVRSVASYLLHCRCCHALTADGGRPWTLSCMQPQDCLLLLIPWGGASGAGVVVYYLCLRRVCASIGFRARISERLHPA